MDPPPGKAIFKDDGPHGLVVAEGSGGIASGWGPPPIAELIHGGGPLATFDRASVRLGLIMSTNRLEELRRLLPPESQPLLDELLEQARLANPECQTTEELIEATFGSTCDRCRQPFADADYLVVPVAGGGIGLVCPRCMQELRLGASVWE